MLPEVSSEDFKSYVKNLRESYNLYIKEKEQNAHDGQEKENVNAVENLMKCYQTVPPQYYDANFRFSLNVIEGCQNIEEVKKVHGKLDEDLSQVQKNLCYQISGKFEAILDAIQGLTEQENEIEDCLERVSEVRRTNQIYKQVNLMKILEISKLKRKQINLQKTVQILEVANVVKKIIPTLKILIQKGNFEYAVNLMESSRADFQTETWLIQMSEQLSCEI